jgi:large subunit ribosomal protein L18
MKTRRHQQRTQNQRIRRAHRVRARITGTPERPRLAVFRSLKHFSAQIIDDVSRKTLLAANDTNVKGTGVERAMAVGKALAAEARKKNITSVVFDRRAYRYHGQVAAFADSVRKAGLTF